jgi:hypothetical protein
VFDRDLATRSIKKPDGLNFNTWAGGRIDGIARDEMLTFKQLSGMDDLVVNKRLRDRWHQELPLPRSHAAWRAHGHRRHVGTKGLTAPQIQDFFNSGKVDRVS